MRMKSAKLMTFLGVVVHSFSGSLMMRSTSSRGIFECSSSIQIAAASAGSDLIEAMASSSAARKALITKGFWSW